MISFEQSKKNANLSSQPGLCSFVLTQFESLFVLILPKIG